MSTAPRFARTHVAQFCAALVAGAGLTVAAPHVLAATAAGEQIKNLATVTYEDAAGNVYSAQSNEAVVTVAQVYAATIGVDVDATATPGQTIYLPYVLKNTGNGTDTFDLSVADGITGDDDLDAAGLQIFRDTNGSGQPEAGEPQVTELSLAADESANLVIAVQVPATATSGQDLGVTLTAVAREGGAAALAADAANVADTSPGAAAGGLGGRDGLDGTVESLITVSGNAVLVTTKSAVHDAANRRITYTVQVQNNGNRAAKNVVIHDGLPAGTTLESQSASGILATNPGDVVATAASLDEVALTGANAGGARFDLNADNDVSDATEAALGIDLDNDGAQDGAAVPGVYAVDALLPPQTTVSMTFTVSYGDAGFAGGYEVVNRAHVSADTNADDDVETNDSLVSSNETRTPVGADYGVTISDTGVGGAAGVNDGGDDDSIGGNATPNDDQFVDSAAPGGVVLFQAVVTNTGNADDIFELAAITSSDPAGTSESFPAGTTFAFYDETGQIALTDTNNSGTDTGVIGAGESKTIVVKATLPAGTAAPTDEYQGTVTATSANDPSATPSTDTVQISLGDIVDAIVDLHNQANGAAGDQDALEAPGTAYTAATTFPGQTGTTVEIPLYVDNESGNADSYVIEAGGSWNGTALGALPPGWSVQFFRATGTGTAQDPIRPDGAALSSTPVIPANTFDFGLIAVVTIPADAALAVDDYVFDNDGDAAGGDVRLDGNGDGDGDYPMFFRLSSSTTGASDIKLDAIDMNATRQLSLVNSGSNQVVPGGTVEYGHTLSNPGNVAETVEITSTNSQAGFTHTLSIDTDGDGAPDTTLDNLPIGADITVQQADGIDVTISVTDADADGVRELAVPPGAALPLTAVVFAPTNAAPGVVDTLAIAATNTDADADAPSVQVEDLTTVINGQVRLVKTVAVDANCDGVVDTTAGEADFAEVQSAGVEPGQCAIWQVVAENQGASDALNVTIADAVTAYSDYEPGSLAFCLNQGCTPAAVTDGAGDDAGEIIGSTIMFYVGTGANPAAAPPADQGGTLVPGEQATARFRVKVQ